MWREVLAFEELHHHERRAGVELADIDDARHVLALDASGGASLTQQTAPRDSAFARRREQQLEGDPLIELQMHRRNDDAHPADAEDLLHPIFLGEQVPLSNG